MADRPTTIHRAPHGELPYFQMSRATAQDEKLSWAARGMLAYLLSKPSDWTIKVKDLEQNCKADKVRSILAELETARYLTSEEVKDGKWADGRWRYELHEVPCAVLSDMDESEPGKTRVGQNTPLHNTEEEQTTDSTEKTEESSVAALPGGDEVIDEKCKQCGRRSTDNGDLCYSCKRFGPYVQMDGWKTLGRVFDEIPNKHIGKSRSTFFVVDRERKCVFLPKFSRRTDADNSELFHSPEIKRAAVDSWEVLTSACGEYTILERIKPPKPAKASAYSSDLIFDALAAALFDATDSADKIAVGGRVGPLREKLIDHVLAKRKVPDLDEATLKDLAEHIRKFPAWYREACPGCDLPQHPNSFMPKWIDYVKSGGKVVPKPGASVPEKQMTVVNGKVVWT